MGPGQEHIKLWYGRFEDQKPADFIEVALVSASVDRIFTVKLLIENNGANNERILAEMRRELDYYLVKKRERDPWLYAKYHCGSAANIYSSVHWSYYPGVPQDRTTNRQPYDSIEYPRKRALRPWERRWKMEHEDILRAYFAFGSDAKGWTALETLDGSILPLYRTKRIAKVQDGCFYFTIGETQHGTSRDLGSRFEEIIAENGRPTLHLPATHGLEKTFVGFDLRTCPAQTL